jgi:hypothetical protein
VSTQEREVQQPVATAATYTATSCFQNGTAAVPLTYTYRVNGVNIALGSMIPAGATTAVGTGLAIVAPGDLVSVGTPATITPGVFGGFTVGP